MEYRDPSDPLTGREIVAIIVVAVLVLGAGVVGLQKVGSPQEHHASEGAKK